MEGLARKASEVRRKSKWDWRCEATDSGKSGGLRADAARDALKRPLPLRLDFGGVVGLVVGNLKAQEGVNGFARFGVFGGDLDLGAAIGLEVAIADFAAELGHDGSAGRVGGVDEHGDVEISGGKELDDVREVHADLVAGGGVFGIVGGDVDDAAGLSEAEVVSSGLVGKAHGMVAPGGHPVVMGGVASWGISWLLG